MTKEDTIDGRCPICYAKICGGHEEDTIEEWYEETIRELSAFAHDSIKQGEIMANRLNLFRFTFLEKPND